MILVVKNNKNKIIIITTSDKVSGLSLASDQSFYMSVDPMCALRRRVSLIIRMPPAPDGMGEVRTEVV